MSTNGSSRLTDILAAHEADLLADWSGNRRPPASDGPAR
jgi:hypothetical protein